MKTISKFLLAVLASTSFMACQKTGVTDFGNVNITAIQEDGIAKMQVTNASQAGTVSFYFQHPSFIKSPVSNVGFPSTTDFLEINAGTYNINVIPFRATTICANATLKFTKDKDYTLFFIDSITKPQLYLLPCNRTPPSEPLKATVRFFNFSPNAPAVDFKLTNLGTVHSSDFIAYNKNFKTQLLNDEELQRKEVIYGPYQIDVFLTGTTTLLFSTKVTVRQGFNYTYFLKGAYQGSDLSIGSVTHNL